MTGPGNVKGNVADFPGNPSAASYRNPIIETALIINVDTENFTVDAIGEMSNRRYLDIPFMQPYAHYMNGEGIYFLPEEGAPCWVCIPSEGDKASFVLGFGAAADSEGKYTNLKRSLNPGDIFLGTRDENFVILRRGGVVQVGGGPLTQRMYIPLGNLIRDVCESYKLTTIGGDLEWTVHRAVEDTDGDRPVSYTFGTKEKANDLNVVCRVTAGYHEDDSDLAYQLEVFSDGSDGQTTQAVLQVKKTGEVSWDVEDTFNVVAKNDIGLRSESGTVVIESSSQSVEVSGKTAVNITSEGPVTVNASSIKLGGDGAANAACMATASLQALVAALPAHVHASLGTPSASLAGLVASDYVSTKNLME